MLSCCRWGAQQHTMRQLQMQQLEVCWGLVRTLVCPSFLECSPLRTWNRYNVFINQGMHPLPALCCWTSGSRQWMAYQSYCAMLLWCVDTWLGGSILALLSLLEFASHLLDYHARAQLASTLLPRPCAKFGNLIDCLCRKCCSAVQHATCVKLLLTVFKADLSIGGIHVLWHLPCSIICHQTLPSSS